MNTITSNDKKPQNPNAFPLEYHGDGMTLRDYFAAKAMSAIIGNRNMLDSIDSNSIEHVSLRSYDFADAMLKQRENV